MALTSSSLVRSMMVAGEERGVASVAEVRSLIFELSVVARVACSLRKM